MKPGIKINKDFIVDRILEVISLPIFLIVFGGILYIPITLIGGAILSFLLPNTSLEQRDTFIFRGGILIGIIIIAYWWYKAFTTVPPEGTDIVYGTVMHHHNREKP